MKTQLIFMAIAAAAAATPAAAGDSAPVLSAGKPEATCRLTTGALRANFGTFNGLSIASQDPASALDYRCPAPVALFWSLGAPGAASGATATVITTRGLGGIVGFAGVEARAGEIAGRVSVVVAP